MTAAAVATKSTVMPIVIGVTAAAVERGIVGGTALMAAAAAQVGMGTVQREIRGAVMVEIPQRPAIGGVTALTLLAQS